MPDEPPIRHGVDMEAYDAALVEAGFEFVDSFDDEDEATTLVFLSSPDAEEAEVEPEAPVLQVDVYQGLYDEPFLGSYVLEGGVLRWEGVGGLGEPGPFNPGPNIGGVQLDRAILATDDYRDGWIECGPDPERWLRRVPGFLDMRGVMYARIVRDTL